MAMEAGYEVESLQRPIYQKDGNEIELLEKLEEKENQEEKILNRILLKDILDSMKDEERELILLRYFANKTQADVGRRMGISQVQVSRMEKKILKQLSEKL
jgi:RNA polymerase sporulation-specific sigma factor